MKRFFKLRLMLVGLGIAVALPLAAVDTTFWQVGSFDEILQGRLTGVSLDKDGVLRLALDTESVFSPDVTVALSMAADKDGSLYIGTGHQGKVFRTDSKRKGTLFFTASEPDIFSLAEGPDGALYVGTSPEGKIYRVTSDGKSTVFFDPKTKYIWALVFDSKGYLYAGTGDRGLIYRIDSSGKGDVFFDSHQTHIMCLKLDAEGNLLAGSDPDGLVYRITPAGKPYVLYQSSLPEIHDLAVDSRGNIYAAALGGPGGKGAAPFLGPNVQPAPAVTGTTVTVVAGTEGDGLSTAQTRPGEPGGNSFSRNAPMNMNFMPPPANLGKGSLVEITPNYSAETIWTSNNEAVFGLAVKGNDVYFSTDTDGRVFDLNPRTDSRELTLLSETGEAMATRLLFEGSDLFIATSNVARVIRLGSSTVKEGTYESTVKDTKTVSRWGTLSWRGDSPDGTSVEFFTRSGNSERPDLTWSDWKGPYLNAKGSPIENDPARYIQWKAVMKTTNGRSPSLDEVTLSYLNQNLPPEIRSFNVQSAGESGNPAGPNPGSFGGGLQPPIGPGGISFSPQAKVKVTSAGGPTSFSWQAEDPNGDQLTYSIYVKASDETSWHLLKEDIRQTNYTLEPHELPDGKYVAKLVASDKDSNPPATARKSEAVSSSFWVDSTPPVVTVVRQSGSGDDVEVQFQAEDGISPLESAETSTDGKEWMDIVSDDGVVDSRQERFTVRAQGLGPGEHIIMLRAYDAVGNVGLGKAVVHVADGGSR